jgi:hypothetical protein
MPALDDEEGWRDRYIGGELGRYIIGGPTDAPPDDVLPPAPERERRDAEHALIDAWVPPPLPAPPDTAPPDDDPEFANTGTSLVCLLGAKAVQHDHETTSTRSTSALGHVHTCYRRAYAARPRRSSSPRSGCMVTSGTGVRVTGVDGRFAQGMVGGQKGSS